MRIDPFQGRGKWFKGNLHAHSTNSDGRLSPAEVVSFYKERGWDFLAFTDHRLYTDNAEFNDKDFLIIPGVELDVSSHDPWRIYHVVGIGKGNLKDKKAGFQHMETIPCPSWKGLESAQYLIDLLNEKGNLSIFCHPIWSRLELGDFLDLERYFAIEIFNYGCAIENHTGLNTDFWDSLLRRGRKVWGVATDDGHNPETQGGGWVMVYAPELSRESILSALEAGRFYSSSGPEIYEYRVEDGEVYVRCSPVRAIHFVAYEEFGYSCWAQDGSTITSARHRLSGREKYVRVECVDIHGNTAWSNPIFLK